MTSRSIDLLTYIGASLCVDASGPDAQILNYSHAKANGPGSTDSWNVGVTGCFLIGWPYGY